MPEPRVVTLDIETAPLESYHWGLWDQTIGLNQLKFDWSILSFSSKELGKPRVTFKSTGGRGVDKVRDDYEVCLALWSVLDSADIIIGQNVKRFDIKKINARLLHHGFKPYTPIKVIDTMLVAKRHFAFTSNKLAFLSGLNDGHKKDEHKLFPGFELWSECLKDNKKAWSEMAIYNKKDVLATEELYLKLRPWMEGHPNVAAYSELEDMLCPKCGSRDVQKRGRALTQTGEYHRFQCGDCGGWSRSRYTTNTTAKRRALLSN